MSKRSNDLSNLNELIQEAYGSREDLAEVLNLAMEMLFYLEENTFDQRDIQHVAFAIRFVREVLRKGD